MHLHRPAMIIDVRTGSLFFVVAAAALIFVEVEARVGGRVDRNFYRAAGA